MDNLLNISHNEHLLYTINSYRGLLWEKIEQFMEHLSELDGVAKHKSFGTKEEATQMEEDFPLKHHFEGGLYTREVFFPQNSIAISFIHKHDHPSFILEGEVYYIDDKGDIQRLKAGDKIFTKVGAQRVIYAHTDARWCCVYKTDKTTVEEAEKEIYTANYRELPKEFLSKHIKQKELCRE